MTKEKVEKITSFMTWANNNERYGIYINSIWWLDIFNIIILGGYDERLGREEIKSMKIVAIGYMIAYLVEKKADMFFILFVSNKDKLFDLLVRAIKNG
jgi:hypothetical protein